MAIQRKDGYVIVQMVLHKDEFVGTFEPARKVEGLTESSFLRVRCGLPVLQVGRKKDGEKSGEKRGKRAGRGAARSSRKRAATSTRQPGPAAGLGVPFAGHREEPPEPAAAAGSTDGTARPEEFEELVDESGLEPGAPAESSRVDGTEIKIELFGDPLEL
jgi:hypothetical protein